MEKVNSLMPNAITKTFDEFVKNNLNEPQRAAVNQKDGALQVIAGAGSGKTRVITSRIANLIINHGVEPRSIVALTFTNKAAGEMKQRLASTFQTYHQLPFIGTFHSYCLLQLRTHAQLLPFPSFSIMDADDQQDLIKKISKKYAMAKQVSPSQLNHYISQLKNNAAAGINSEKLQWMPPHVREVYLEYETQKNQAHCLDFDDLIIYVLQFLQTNKEYKKEFQTNVRHILIDEYQDTSAVQHKLLLAMAHNDKNKTAMDSVCAVGDEDQSIYSWRGATVANMLKFQKDFAPVTLVKIEQNYRSAQPILDAANAVIGNNRLRNPKNLWSTRKADDRIMALCCQSGDQEAQMVATILKSIERKKQLNEVALLYRTHFLSRPLEEALLHHGIPYRIIGGIRFYERKEIKDLLAYLRLIVNAYDKLSLMRIINTPARGLGQKFEEQLMQASVQNPLLDFHQLLKFMQDDKTLALPPNKVESITALLKMFADLNPRLAPRFLLDTIIERTNYIGYLTQTYDMAEAQTKIENVQEFAQAVSVFEQKQTNMGTTADAKHASLLETFLHEVSLLQEKMTDDNAANCVQLMTLHAAKGLEFDTVILTGLEEGLLPNTKSLNTNEALEEERRLMYVGMTRAKEHLVLTSAWSRFTYGQVTDQAPSRFLQEIPRGLVNLIDLDTHKLPQAPLFFDRWFASKETTATATAAAHEKPAHLLDDAPQVPTRANTTIRPEYFAKHSKAKCIEGSERSNTPAKAVQKEYVDSNDPRRGWTKNQTVYHEKFGVGIVSDVERAPENDVYVTALFKMGKKKILGSFLEKK